MTARGGKKKRRKTMTKVEPTPTDIFYDQVLSWKPPFGQAMEYTLTRLLETLFKLRAERHPPPKKIIRGVLDSTKAKESELVPVEETSMYRETEAKRRADARIERYRKFCLEHSKIPDRFYLEIQDLGKAHVLKQAWHWCGEEGYEAPPEWLKAGNPHIWGGQESPPEIDGFTPRELYAVEECGLALTLLNCARGWEKDDPRRALHLLHESSKLRELAGWGIFEILDRQHMEAMRLARSKGRREDVAALGGEATASRMSEVHRECFQLYVRLRNSPKSKLLKTKGFAIAITQPLMDYAEQRNIKWPRGSSYKIGFASVERWIRKFKSDEKRRDGSSGKK